MAGRKREDGERFPSGKLKPANDEPPFALTPEALRHRAEELGIDPIYLIETKAARDRVCMDADAGTALGRIAYQFDRDGLASPRMGMFGGSREPWLTEDMMDAADKYRILWATYHRRSGLPARNPRGQQFERRDPRAPDDRDPTKEEIAADRDLIERLNAAQRAISMPNVWRSVEKIVINDELPIGLIELGPFSSHLLALRSGLRALHRVLSMSVAEKVADDPGALREAA